MGFIDRLLGAAPGIAAQGIQAQRFGAEKRQKDLEDSEDRSRAIQRQALQNSLLQGQIDNQPIQRDLLSSEATWRRAEAAKAGMPPVPKPIDYQLKTAKGGLVTPVNPATGLDPQGNRVVEREPAPAQGPSDQLVYNEKTGKYVWANPRSHSLSDAGDLAPHPQAKDAAQARIDAVLRESAHQIGGAVAGLRGQGGQRGIPATRPSDTEIANALKNPNAAIVFSNAGQNRWLAHVTELATLQAAARGQRGMGAIDNIKRALMRSPDQLELALQDAEDSMQRISQPQGGHAAPSDDADAAATAYLAKRRKKP